MAVASYISPASADSTEDPNNNGDQPEASNTRDPRLPPVLPGEEVTTENGDKMRVWSSGGPVSVGAVPQAPQLNNNAPNLGGVGVIVDQRRDLPIVNPRR